jgi:hypothetical protein
MVLMVVSGIFFQVFVASAELVGQIRQRLFFSIFVVGKNLQANGDISEMTVKFL